MKAGKSSNIALLRTVTAKGGLNFATRRLIKDYEEFEKNTLPTVGVAARPMDDDLFNWHANIRGPEGTSYEGGVFHLELRIPETYPHNPPTVEILGVDLPHPNIFGRSICLDMLQSSRNAGEGWSSGYSIMSILIQLQSFLFEKFYDDNEKEKQIKKAIEQANQFKCTRKNCKHGGKLAAWPAFNVKESDPEAFKIVEGEVDLFKKELVCYHTKLTHDENHLGIGLSISRIARTGLIKQASPCLDYLSLKAFIKEGIRESSFNEKFTHWLPLFFGTQKDRTLHLGKKSISMICAGSTKRFKETMILDLFPKILVTLSVLIMNEKRHASIRILKIFLHVHYLYLTFLQEYPQLNQEIEKVIDEFNKDEAKRHKEVIQSLGAFQTNFIVLWDKLEGSLPAIQQEQFDRQVFWILKSVPELVDEASDTYLDDKRTEITFKAQQTSYQVLLFWVMISKFFKTNFKSTKELTAFYEKNLGRLTEQMENEIQKNCFKILKIGNYDEMFEFMGMGKISQEDLNKKLKDAIKNSKRRKYHGTDDEILTLPNKDEQIKSLEENFPTTIKLINAEKKTLKELPESEWKENCIKRWLWIRDLCEHKEKIKPSDVAIISDDLYYNQHAKQVETLVEIKNQYLQNMSQDNTNSLSKNIRYKDTFTWRDLFLKLDLESTLLNMDNNPDFKAFYAKIQTIAPFITSLVIPIVSVKNIKSGHYYLTSLLTDLLKLKHLQIVGTSSSQEFNLSALKAFAKGFVNFLKAGGQLDEIKYGKFNIPGTKPNEVQDKLFNTLLSLTGIHTLTIENNNIFSGGFNGSKSIAKMILTHKNLTEINLQNVNLQDAQGKDIADSLMRAKGLEYLNLSYNNTLRAAGLTSVIYNLAFSPRLVCLDISHIPLSSDSNLIEAIYKLLRISASLEVLNMCYCGSLNNNLPEQFFVALGEVRTLRKLDMSYSGSLSTNACQNLGKAIAFNAKKMGSLEYVNLDGAVVSSYYSLQCMFDAMHIAESDHETWYGDPNKVSKMSGQDFAKVYYNNLKNLQLNLCSLATGFDYNNWKKQYNPQDPHFVKLLARSPQLSNVQLSRASLGPKDADILLLALDPSRAEFCSKIKILNLSRNNLGKEGIKTLATIFEKNNIIESLDVSHNNLGVAGAICLAKGLTQNKSLKYLNLFSNKIDVDGARAFELTLKENSSLEYIDFGHNRLRDEGLNAIARGIASNKNSKIKHLGLRFNFIDDDGIVSFLKKVFPEGGKTTLESIFIKNNSINEFGLYDILKVYKKMGIKLSIDIFDKLKLVENDILERTIWVHPAPGTPEDIKNFFENTHQCGIVVNVRKRTGPAWPNRKIQSNTFYFVEFASAISVTRALHVASRKQSNLNGVNMRIYKAGSGTYNYTKAKKKKIGKSRTNCVGRGRPRGGKTRAFNRGGRRR